MAMDNGMGGYNPAAGITGAMSAMNGSASGGQYPLEGAMTDKIMGVLNNPSPYSAEQTAMMRNRATAGVEQQGRTARQQAQEDAARRGLNPSEAAGNLNALGARYDHARSSALNDFELQNAQATRQGLMGGLSAGQGLLGSQFGNEASIRQYLAMLGAAQMGQQPMFLNSMGGG